VSFVKVFFRLERTRQNANVDPVGNGVYEGNNQEQSCSLKGAELTEPQDNRSIPLIRDLNCGRDDECQDDCGTQNPYRFEVSRNPMHGVRQCCADAQHHHKYQDCK
jgi:hypothetical protein